MSPTPALNSDGAAYLAGACFVAMRHSNPEFLQAIPPTPVLELSGLAGTYANLCLHYGVSISADIAVHGVHLTAYNNARWRALLELLGQLQQQGLAPVLFKGGALHARWPEFRKWRYLDDYDLITLQADVDRLRRALRHFGFLPVEVGGWLTRRLSKGSMFCKGYGLHHQNLDIHARVTEQPVCTSLTSSILATRCLASGVRVPELYDCVCMIALHVVRSGMARPLREYIDLLWYVDGLDDSEWLELLATAKRHHLLPGLFLTLRQAHHCLALDQVAPDSAVRLARRVAALASGIDPIRGSLIDWLAPPDRPLHPLAWIQRPIYRRSLVLLAGTSSTWRVLVAFLVYGASRLLDGVLRLGLTRPVSP